LVRHCSKQREDGILGLDLPDFEKFLFQGGDDDINVNLKELNHLSPMEARSLASRAMVV
jgi:hypothetical protein